MTEQRAVILLSGGLDSATVLAMARAQGYRCYALSFDYGQRHRTELQAAQKIADRIGVDQYKTVRIDLRNIGGSALTSDIAVPEQESTGIPITYVPARNTVFMSIALGWAEVLEADAIFVGVNAVDYSGYPDCRPDYIHAFEAMANLATKRGVEGHKLKIHTPLMQLTKAQIIKEGTALGVDYALTISCYQANDFGQACGRCDSCRLRRQGFIEAGLSDPTLYQ
ncbi:Queuosine Biosynthesis QueC ATPase [Methylophaga frappieri]|uniref:7-cyano-7-deazaguanine synthase n=1 Tax=Methylophaga frappieri (strain ATCC BAA-2434 / DSM 25690 / JAM7) TaxID=754477 RepID=I1YIX2_METFJ|nr:7-cyano-7-deazaguanine synthase QueC [Methylophaga frappieri]AFJ02865.1 Queuosine Biosynthesis QueC ATPase [Methylophaga frappieri]